MYSVKDIKASTEKEEIEFVTRTDDMRTPRLFKTITVPAYGFHDNENYSPSKTVSSKGFKYNSQGGRTIESKDYTYTSERDNTDFFSIENDED